MATATKTRATLVDVRKIFWVAIAILTFLLILSLVVLSVRVGVFVWSGNRELNITSRVHDDQVDIFGVEYTNADGEITVSGMDGDKVLAPGTRVDYSLRIRNSDIIAINYDLSSEITMTSEFALPLVVRLIGPEGEWLLGDETTWVDISELSQVCHSYTLASGESAEYTFQWKWSYEGDDQYDTFLGNLDQDVGLSLSMTVSATANMGIDANGGLLRSGWLVVFVAILFGILLLCAIVLLVVSVIRRRKIVQIIPEPEPIAEPEPIPVIVPVPEPEPEPIPEPEPVIVPLPAPVPKEGYFGKMAIINLDVLENHFADGDTVTLAILKSRGLIPANARQMKVLARNGYRLTKALTVHTQGISAQARKQIAQAGGSVVITGP